MLTIPQFGAIHRNLTPEDTVIKLKSTKTDVAMLLHERTKKSILYTGKDATYENMSKKWSKGGYRRFLFKATEEKKLQSFIDKFEKGQI